MSIIMSGHETCKNGKKIKKKIVELGNVFFPHMDPKSQ